MSLPAFTEINYDQLFALRESEASIEVFEASLVVKDRTSKGGLRDLAISRTDSGYRLNPFHIAVRKDWNLRDLKDQGNIAHIFALARSIAVHGVKTPLRVFMDGGKAYLVEGHMRLAAVLVAINYLNAKIFSVPVITDERGTSDEDREIGQIISNIGKRPTTLEIAGRVTSFYSRGWEIERIAVALDYSAARVYQLLKINEMPEEIKNLVRTGSVSTTEAHKVFEASQTSSEAIAALTTAVSTAASEGKKKATARHVEQGEGSEPVTRLSVKKALKDAFEKASIDNSGETEVVIRFSTVDFEVIRNLLKL